MEAGTNPLGWPTALWRLLHLLAAFLAVYGLAVGLSQIARAVMLLNDYGFTEVGARATLALFGTTCLVSLSIALLVLSRGRNDAKAVLLAMALLAAAPLSAHANLPWASTGNILLYVDRAARPLIAATLALFWPLFALHVAGAASKRRARHTVTTVALVLAAASALAAFAPAFIEFNSQLAVAVDVGNFLVVQATGFVILLWFYSRNDVPSRNRIKIVLAAFLAYLLSWTQARELIALANRGETDWIVPLAVGATASGLLGAGLIAYAVLRQRLFDFGFALNRTLVYATVSFVLLAAFGGAKWVIEHLIPESWHAGSEYYSFAIALALFLVLHRVHTWVEHSVERVFFGPWHRNEAALKRFVAAAGHFEDTGELCRAFTDELRRFAGGAGAAIYRRDRSGAYAMQHASLADLPASYPADDLALALMRAERGAVKLAETQTVLPGALALPMLDHGRLSGFALLDRKPDGADYRPDEIEALALAVRQVGLDLQTMHVGELEDEVAGLSARLAQIAKARRSKGAGFAA